MIKNRLTQLIFKITFLVFAFFGMLSSLGLFNQELNTDWHVYYTNLSNFVCIIIMIVSTIDLLKQMSKGELVGLNTKHTVLRSQATIWILVTFLVYNILLGDPTTLEYWSGVGNITFHFACPLLFALDCILFDDHSKMKWWECLLTPIVPIIYIAYIYIRSAIVAHTPDNVIYPYFFFDIDTLGIKGVVIYIICLIVFFIILGFILFGLYKMVEKRKSKA